MLLPAEKLRDKKYFYSQFHLKETKIVNLLENHMANLFPRMPVPLATGTGRTVGNGCEIGKWLGNTRGWWMTGANGGAMHNCTGCGAAPAWKYKL